MTQNIHGQETVGNNNQGSAPVANNNQPRTSANSGARKAHQHYRSTSADTPKWQAARDSKEKSTNLDVAITEVAVKEGRPRGVYFSLDGVKGFIPGSELPKGTNQQGLVGKTISVKIIEVNRRQGILKASRLQVVAEEQTAFFAKLESETNPVVTGVVERKTDFGWFVNLGCIDGLVHISNAPQEGLTIGQEVTARVVRLNAEEGKIGLSLRDDAPQGRGRGGRTGGNNGNFGGNSNSGRGRHGNVEAFNNRFSSRQQKPRPTVTVSSTPATPRKPKVQTLRSGRKDGFTQSFTSFQDLAAFFAQKDAANTGDATPAPTDAAAPTAE